MEARNKVPKPKTSDVTRVRSATGNWGLEQHILHPGTRITASIYINYDLRATTYCYARESGTRLRQEKTERWARWYSQKSKHSVQDNWRDRLFDGTRPIKRVLTDTDRASVVFFSTMVMRKNNTFCAAFIVKSGTVGVLQGSRFMSLARLSWLPW